MLSEKQFTQAYNEFKNYAYGICCRIGRFDDNEIADIYNTSFERIWRFRENYEEQGQLKAFVARVVNNTTILYVRKRNRTVTHSAISLSGEMDYLISHTIETWEEPFNDRVQSVLDELPPVMRELLLLVDTGDMLLHEYADYKGVAQGTGLSRHSRAKEKFRRLYGIAA